MNLTIWSIGVIISDDDGKLWEYDGPWDDELIEVIEQTPGDRDPIIRIIPRSDYWELFPGMPR